ncbi:hypothetical protein GCM10009557_31120 [Virgisporangium ochraceum]|uniref:Deacetylase sirtuin-type domain-containing protein n=1 Tax=Virgisporangium ochraceum TaxID=65505 RepID=A0A8J4EJY8_9ACTN|nr:hypothetical protein Voc01_097490 [Virgisporangium ochraceum]
MVWFGEVLPEAALEAAVNAAVNAAAACGVLLIVGTSGVVYPAVAALYETHRNAPFPSQWRGADVAGSDMVLLDSDPSACISVWLQQGGVLDDWSWRSFRTRNSGSFASSPNWTTTAVRTISESWT